MAALLGAPDSAPIPVGSGVSWETRLDDTGSMSQYLFKLDLSFSTITLSTLRSLLVVDRNGRQVSAFPNLSQLFLAHTPGIPFTIPLFQLFAALVTLRTLSIAGKTTDQNLPSTVNQLSLATPALTLLDLSYTPFGKNIAQLVDWSSRWRSLSRLIVRNCGEKPLSFKSHPSQRTEAATAKLKREIWAGIKGEDETRSWIEIEV